MNESIFSLKSVSLEIIKNEVHLKYNLMQPDQINVNFPTELASSLRMRNTEFADEMLKLAVIKLYELGKISSGIAAKAIGINRVSFLEQLQKYQVSIFNDTESLIDDFKNA